MKNALYEWDVEELDDDGDTVAEHHFGRRCAPLMSAWFDRLRDGTAALVLVRTASRGRSWARANIKDREFPASFDDDVTVPARFRVEYSVAWDAIRIGRD